MTFVAPDRTNKGSQHRKSIKNKSSLFKMTHVLLISLPLVCEHFLAFWPSGTFPNTDLELAISTKDSGSF